MFEVGKKYTSIYSHNNPICIAIDGDKGWLKYPDGSGSIYTWGSDMKWKECVPEQWVIIIRSTAKNPLYKYPTDHILGGAVYDSLKEAEAAYKINESCGSFPTYWEFVRIAKISPNT